MFFGFAVIYATLLPLLSSYLTPHRFLLHKTLPRGWVPKQRLLHYTISFLHSRFHLLSIIRLNENYVELCYSPSPASFEKVLLVFLARCCTASECFRVLLKVIYLSHSTSNLLISFGFVVQMILVIGFSDNAIKIFGNYWHLSCYYSAWTTVFTREFSECFQKSLFSSGLTYL